MSDIDEGVGWRIKADMSDVLAAYDKAEAASKKASDTAVAGALKAGDAMAKAGASAQKTGEAWTKAAESGAKGFTSATGAVDRFIARVNDSQTKLQALQNRFAAMQGTFAKGQGQSTGDFTNSLLQAGSLRAFVGAAGGPVGAAALTAGFAYGQTQQYAAIGDLADKARASAQEVEGLQRVLQKLGVDAVASNGILGSFADKLSEAQQNGGALRTALESMGIALTNADGTTRSTLAVLGDFAAKIKATTDEDEKLRLATLAVGDQLAGSFLQAVNQSKDGLGRLEEASRLAGSSFTNDLAKGAQVAMAALKELGDRAEGVYTQIKRAIGAATEADKTKAAVEDYRQAGDRLHAAQRGLGGPVTVDDYGRQTSGFTQSDVDRLERELYVAGVKAGAAGASLGAYDPSKLANVGLRFVPGGDPKEANVFRTLTGGVQGPDYQEPAPKSDGGSAAGGARGGGSSAKAEEVDRAQQVIDRLREQLAATKDLDTANGSIVEKQRTVAELLRAGVTLESEQGQQIAGLVSQIDAVRRAEQSRVEALQQVRTLTADVAGGIDQWLVGGQKFGTAMQGVLKQMESQMLRMALIGGNGKGGLFGSLLSGFGGGGEGGGFLEKIAGFFAGKFADGGEIPAGQFGLVGEAGPELVTGPRQITPLHRMASGGAPVINNVWNVAGVTSREEVMGWIRDGMNATHQQTLAAVPGYIRDQQDRGF